MSFLDNITPDFLKSEPKTAEDASKVAEELNTEALELKTKADAAAAKARDAKELAARLAQQEKGATSMQGQINTTTGQPVPGMQQPGTMYEADSKGGRRRSRKQAGGRRRRTRRGKRSGCKRCGLKRCVCSKKRRTRR